LFELIGSSHIVLELVRYEKEAFYIIQSFNTARLKPRSDARDRAPVNLTLSL